VDILYENELPIIIDISQSLANMGLTITQVTDFAFGAKVSATDSDESAVLLKTISGGGVTKDTQSNLFIVSLSASDYGVGKLELGKTYEIAIGIKYAGVTKFIESNEFKDADPTITIKQDFFRS
jgi:hypothetical protein